MKSDLDCRWFKYSMCQYNSINKEKCLEADWTLFVKPIIEIDLEQYCRMAE
jgi:hypothetical protein